MWRLRVELSGAAVTGPGVSTFYALDTSPGFPAAVRSFYSSLTGNMPQGLTITVPNGGDVIDAATGNITGEWSDGAPTAALGGSVNGAYAQGVGAQVRWRTSGIVGGRRVVGSTFIVPLAGGAFQNDGSLLETVRSAILSSADAYLTAAPYAVIWSRPSGARVGSSHLIVSASVPDRPSWLRSRRS